MQRDGAIATVVLNRPHKLNALTKPMWRRLGEVMTELSEDEALRCVVLRGAGGKSFAPGNDISEFAAERSNAVQAKAYFGLTGNRWPNGEHRDQQRKNGDFCAHYPVLQIKSDQGIMTQGRRPPK